MIFALMVTATLAALIAGIACYAMKMKNSYAVLLVQFLVSMGASFAIAYWLGKGVFTNGYIAAVCAVISLVIYGILFVTRKFLGPLDSRRPGAWAKKYSQHHHNPARHKNRSQHS